LTGYPSLFLILDHRMAGYDGTSGKSLFLNTLWKFLHAGRVDHEKDVLLLTPLNHIWYSTVSFKAFFQVGIHLLFGYAGGQKRKESAL